MPTTSSPSKPDRKSHKPRRPDRRALMPVGLSRHTEISSHGFSPQTSDFFAVHNGEITFSASVPVQFNAAGDRGGARRKSMRPWGRDRIGAFTLAAAELRKGVGMNTYVGRADLTPDERL